ncbi:hypothetical protein SAMN05216410_2748 [Sanguibacter gelidistatuariae]|uniref:CueP family metal-binding protein n=1 Tax=Sanguibacter gelidistatuariae TaxID=1814289 RepID=A0A1G6RPW8_9MICO|nr:CueP family metal-binding protein [Sanguibacter gelidistatuariae]SDD06740.1 hypothetical protein SAMN05216410_2748 [Sanguibacter gelidistatuariae]
MKTRLLLALAVAVSVPLAGCATTDGASLSPDSSTTAQDAPALLADFDLTGMDAREAIEHLDPLGGSERPSALMASIRADELLLSADGRETTLDMPTDGFYVSIAPYVDQTHDCFFHSLTTCQGELAGADLQITVTDDATGQTLIDEQKTTYDNGFVGLWLPRDMTGTLTVTHDGKSVESPISTNADSATCLTTLKLV